MTSTDLWNNAKSFHELFKCHLEWISGLSHGTGYNDGFVESKRTLQNLRGDFDFINLLRYVSINLKMVTTGSQPSEMVSIDNSNIDKHVSSKVYYYDKIAATLSCTLKRRPYITGFVTYNTFLKIMRTNQKDLIIIGSLPPHCDPMIRINKNHLKKYNIKKSLGSLLVYTKNMVSEKDDNWVSTVFLTKYENIDKDSVKSTIIEYQMGYGYRNKESDAYHCSKKRMMAGNPLLQDNELCEIVIIHPEYGVDPKIFEKQIMELCKEVHPRKSIY